MQIATRQNCNVTSSSAMAERRVSSAILSGCVTLGLNFRLKGYVSYGSVPCIGYMHSIAIQGRPTALD